MLPYVVGIVLSIGVALFARWVGFDRDRAFYPTVLIVIASYYVLFAAMIGSMQTVVLESALMTLFVIAAVAGFKGSAWIVVAALAGHGVQDAVHGHIVANAGVPAWWPAWCLAYDVGAAAALAWLLMRADSPRLVVTDTRSRMQGRETLDVAMTTVHIDGRASTAYIRSVISFELDSDRASRATA